MGWIELQGWLAVLRVQREGKRAGPGSWAGHESDPQWAELRAARDRMREGS